MSTEQSGDESSSIDEFFGRVFLYLCGAAIVLFACTAASFAAAWVISTVDCEFDPQSKRCLALEARSAARDARDSSSSGLFP